MRIIQKSDVHNEFVRSDLISLFGSEHIISIRNQYLEASKLDGFLAEEGSSLLGILLFAVDSDECELVYIHAVKPGLGIGKKLLERLIEAIKNRGIKRLWVITTNDNLEALSFYQKRGFALLKVYPNAMDKVRKIKPSVPVTGKNGIPLRDMIELEMRI